MIFGLGWPEIAVIIIILVLLFGGKKIPELARGISDALKEFQKGSKKDEK